MENREEKKSEIMNLIGYGMAKFDYDFIREFGVNTKSAFCQYLVDIGLAKTIKAVFNRQDSFDPYFDNGRRGWFQRNQREHIKLFIDNLFGNENAHNFANIVKVFIQELDTTIILTEEKLSPVTKSKFKQLQETGKEAEFYFMKNYHDIPLFNGGKIEDARLWGDGYDFQILKDNNYLLAEIKGIREKSGSIRMTENEYKRAQEFLSDYILVVVSNLSNSPKLSIIENPVNSLSLTPCEYKSLQINYYSETINW